MPSWVVEGMYPNDPDGQRRAVLHWHRMQREGWTTQEERDAVRRELWPCTDGARDLIQEALSAAFQYGEMPPPGDPKFTNERQKVLLGMYRQTKFTLVRYVAELEKLAGIPGVWLQETNIARVNAVALKYPPRRVTPKKKAPKKAPKKKATTKR